MAAPQTDIDSRTMASSETDNIDPLITVLDRPVHDDMDTSENLFNGVMRGNWQTVATLYKTKPHVKFTKITHTEDTVLHLAVVEGDAYVVHELLEALVDEKEMEDVLMAKNKDSGDTPLHIAAALGNLEVCNMLAKKCPVVIAKARNNKNHTPFFTAAEYNQKNVFLLFKYYVDPLHLCVDEKIKELVRGMGYLRSGEDGNTVLHRAVFGEYFGTRNF